MRSSNLETDWRVFIEVRKGLLGILGGMQEISRERSEEYKQGLSLKLTQRSLLHNLIITPLDLSYP